MRTGILTGILFLIFSNSISAQFVGDGAAGASSTQAASTGKMSFTLKFGAAIPLAEFKTIPSRTASPQYSTGIMGAKTGFFAETGMGLSLTNPEKKVGFYYFPVLGSYWRTSLDWSELGGFFSDKTIYTKPVNILDIGQRYGIEVKPVNDLSVALYYRPGLIIPFKFEIIHESATNGESFLFTGELSTGDDIPIFMMSHTAGFSVSYMMASLSFERYAARPTYDVHYKDLDTSPLMAVDVSTTGKIPVKIFVVSLALTF